MAGGAEDEEAAAAALLQLLEEENERLARDRRNVAFPPSPARSQSAPLSAATSLSASATSLAVGSPPSPLPTDGHTARATTPAKPQAVAQASVANTNTNAKTQASDSDSLSPADIAAVAEERARVHAWSDTLPQLPQLLKKRPRRVVDLAAGGIPAALRCVAWQHLARARATLALGSATTGNTGDALSSATGSLSPHAESETAYPELLTRESRHERAIRRDIARTFPNHALFQESERERAAAAAQEAADAAGSMDSCSESGDEDEGDDETEPRSAPSEVPSEAAGGSTSAAEEEHRETDTTAVKRDCAADSDLTAAEKAHTEHTDHSQDTEAATLAPGGAVSEPCSGRTSAGSATTTDESHTQQHSRRRHRPQQPRLPEGRGQATLFNVLKAYSLYDPEVGYCQGSPFIAGVLLMHMPEEDAFNTLTLLMRHYALRGLFTPDMADLPLRLHQLECLVAQTLPDVHAHFTALGLAPSMYASSWFLTLFSSSLPLPLVFRIVDVFLVEGLPALFRAALALLSLSRLTLVADSFENALHSLTRAEALARFAGREEEFMRASRAFSFSEKSLARWESEYQRERQAEQQRNSALGRAEAERDRLAAENTALRKQVRACRVAVTACFRLCYRYFRASLKMSVCFCLLRYRFSSLLSCLVLLTFSCS